MSATNTWPDLAIGLYDKLTGRDAELTTRWTTSWSRCPLASATMRRTPPGSSTARFGSGRGTAPHREGPGPCRRGALHGGVADGRARRVLRRRGNEHRSVGPRDRAARSPVAGLGSAQEGGAAGRRSTLRRDRATRARTSGSRSPHPRRAVASRPKSGDLPRFDR